MIAKARLESDRAELARFIDATFRYADDGTDAALRTFAEGSSEVLGSVRVPLNGAGLDPIIDHAAHPATKAANATRPAVFAPPVATFVESRTRERDLGNGLVLSVEADQAPAIARRNVQFVLGPPTVVVASGGHWTDPEPGEVEAKLHLLQERHTDGHYTCRAVPRTPAAWRSDVIREGDSLTVVWDARGGALTKRYDLRRGRVVKSNYPNVAEVIATEVPVDGIDSLAAALDRVTVGGIAAVIRGAPGKFYPRNGCPAFRLLRPQEGLVAARTGARISNYAIRKHNLEPDHDNRWAVTWLPTFEDRPRSWVIFDVDRIPVPEHMAGDWVDEPEAAVEHVLDALPGAFRTSTCWWSLSGSAAVPGPNGREVASAFKLKLAFWLSRALTGAQLKRWMAAERAPVDPAVFGAVQLIYLARPGFSPGLHDPVPRRSGVWRGDGEAVAVPDVLPDPPLDETEAAAFGPVEGLDELCDALRDRLAGELHVREHLLQAARAYVRQHGPSIDQAALVAALESVALEYRSRVEVAGYGMDRLVDHLVQKERAATYIRSGPTAPQQAVLPPYFGTEGTNMFAVIGDQRRALRSWLRRNHLFARARREIAVRREAAFAAEGLA